MAEDTNTHIHNNNTQKMGCAVSNTTSGVAELTILNISPLPSLTYSFRNRYDELFMILDVISDEVMEGEGWKLLMEKSLVYSDGPTAKVPRQSPSPNARL